MHRHDGVAALLHQPPRRGGRTTYSDGLDTVEPLLLDLVRILDQTSVGVYAQALVEEHLTVRALAPADEEDEIVLGGKLRDVRHTVGHVTADGVEALEDGSRGDMRLDIVDDAVELVERLRGLRIEEDIMTEVELLHLVEVLDDDGRRLRLSYETEHLGMRAFPTMSRVLRT